MLAAISCAALPSRNLISLCTSSSNWRAPRLRLEQKLTTCSIIQTLLYPATRRAHLPWVGMETPYSKISPVISPATSAGSSQLWARGVRSNWTRVLLSSRPGSIHSDQKHGAFLRLCLACDRFRPRFLIIQHAYSQPFARRPGELQHFGSLVSAHKPLFQPARILLIRECADLHTPASAGRDRRWRLQHLN